MVKITIEFDTLADAAPVLALLSGATTLADPPPAAMEPPTPQRRRRSKSEATEAPPAPVTPPVAPPAAPPGDWDEDPPPPPAALPPAPVTKDEVRAALVAYQTRTSMEKAQALLKDVGGVEKLGALPESKYAEVIKATQSAK